MKPELTLSIPSPCHEKWSSFTRTANGGFCSSCQREVIDFTSWSDDKLKLWFKEERAGVCGRFRSDQLKTYTLDTPHVGSWKWLATAILGVILSLVNSRHAVAQGKIARVPIEQHIATQYTVGVTVTEEMKTVTIKGVVQDETGETLPGVNIERKGTNEKVLSGANGEFSITLVDSVPSDTLAFSFIGYGTFEYPLTAYTGKSVIAKMTPEITGLLGEVIVYKDILPWYSPKRWWLEIKSLF